MDAVDRADLHTGVVLRADAGLCDDVGHVAANLANTLWELAFRVMAITSRILRERGKRQAEKLGIDPARVPPGQYLTERFPVLTVGPNPPFDLATWHFTVFGEVENELTLSWDELRALPHQPVKTDIHCVTRWSKLDTEWLGVPVREVLDRAGTRPSGTHVMAYSDGGYTTNVPLSALYDDDVLLAHTYDGLPLEPDHGAPLRLLV